MKILVGFVRAILVVGCASCLVAAKAARTMVNGVSYDLLRV